MAVLAIRILLALAYFSPEIFMTIFLVALFICYLLDRRDENRVARNLDDAERTRRTSQMEEALTTRRVIHDVVARELRLQVYLDQLDTSSLHNNVPPGQTKDHIFKSSKCKNENYDCVICLEEFKEKEMVRVVEPCNHMFHKYCLTKWLPQHQTCPTCRRHVPSLNYAPANTTISEV